MPLEIVDLKLAVLKLDEQYISEFSIQDKVSGISAYGSSQECQTDRCCVKERYIL